jgi:hypothetical protein
VAPNEFSESGDWKLAATRDTSLLSAKVNLQPDELCGIRGMSLVDRLLTQPAGTCARGPVRTAWQVSTGRPDVVIAVLDSGIEWNDSSAMSDLRAKVRLNQGELPAPRTVRDLMCGRAARYELVTSRHRITAQNFARGRRVAVALAPAQPGSVQTLRLPRGLGRYVALRALDATGNLGRPMVLRLGG